MILTSKETKENLDSSAGKRIICLPRYRKIRRKANG